MRTNNNELCKFRARMNKRGYRAIHIKYNKDGGCYNITAIEPLGSTWVTAQYSAEAIMHSFRF